MEREWYDRSPHVNQSLVNPESCYGVRNPIVSVSYCTNKKQLIAPTTPLANKKLIWHMHSSQAYGVSSTATTIHLPPALLIAI